MNQKFYLMPCLYNSPFKPFIAMNIKITLREILIEGKSRCTSTINISQGRLHFVENPNFAEFTGKFKLMDYGFVFFFLLLFELKNISSIIICINFAFIAFAPEQKCSRWSESRFINSYFDAAHLQWVCENKISGFSCQI